MAFKMKYGKTSFPFFNPKEESWAEGTTGKQRRTERRMRKLARRGKDVKGKNWLGMRTKYQRQLDRIARMKEDDIYVPQGKTMDEHGNIISAGTLGKDGDSNYGKYYYEPSIMGSEGTTTEQNQQLANLRHKG
tara:strand:- start:284 stop:682 length:399 start_codon:yes stop_codon:yes gene_type:complete